MAKFKKISLSVKVDDDRTLYRSINVYAYKSVNVSNIIKKVFGIVTDTLIHNGNTINLNEPNIYDRLENNKTYKIPIEPKQILFKLSGHQQSIKTIDIIPCINIENLLKRKFNIPNIRIISRLGWYIYSKDIKYDVFEKDVVYTIHVNPK